ncbi:unannotated protein [freshwater metagenome]|uniref:Unannotated protein n=1 Tax=freshwater metagenome TaxID=449393 RepID=A0A6J6EFP0_9ZZZZ
MVDVAQKPGQLYRAIGASGELADNARPAVASRRRVVPEVFDTPRTGRFILVTFAVLSLTAAIEDWLRGEIGMITGVAGIALVLIGRGMLNKADLAYLVATPPAAYLVAVTLPDLIGIAQSANPINQLSATIFTRLSNLAPFVLTAFGISFLLYKIANRK